MKRVRELAARHGVEPEPLEAVLEALAREPDPPTSVTDPVDEHLADSLSALPFLGAPRRLADIGSGAGFPGLVLAAALPACAVTLFESQRRHAAVAERVARGAGLANVAVVPDRVEAWPRGRGRSAADVDAAKDADPVADEHATGARFDVVTARAVGPLAVLVEYAAPLLVEGGRLVAWKGARAEAEERAGREAASAVGLAPGGVEPVVPFPGAHSRHLHFYVKTAATPARFPRRPGMARKRPLAR